MPVDTSRRSSGAGASDELGRPVMASLWRRLFAYLEDMFLLGIVGFGLGRFLVDEFAELGPWGRLVGFCIALFYFSLFDSAVGGGQTFGKRWLGVKVIDSNGHPLSLTKSLIRSVVFLLPCFLFGIKLPLSHASGSIYPVVYAIVIGVGGATLYFLIGDRKRRQGLHDRAAVSFVIPAIESGPVRPGRTWRAHWFILAAFLLAAAFAGASLQLKVSQSSYLQRMNRSSEAIDQLPDVERASMTTLVFRGTNGKHALRALSANVVLKSKCTNQDALADSVASLILKTNPVAKNYDKMIVQLFYGYDIGIAFHWDRQEFSLTPTEWAERMQGTSSRALHAGQP